MEINIIFKGQGGIMSVSTLANYEDQWAILVEGLERGRLCRALGPLGVQSIVRLHAWNKDRAVLQGKLILLDIGIQDLCDDAGNFCFWDG